MVLVIETQYFPPVLTFATALQHGGELRWEAHEHYQKAGYRARCRIAAANGVLQLSVPLRKGKNEQQSIQETEIAYREPWHRQHWQSIRSAYGRAPYFDFYADPLRAILESQPPTLWALNRQLAQTIIDLLQLPLRLTQTTSYQPAVPAVEGLLDLRGQLTHRDQQLTLPLDDLVPYPQLFADRHGFLRNLSILDLLFCTGPEAIRYLQEAVTPHALNQPYIGATTQ